MPSESNSRFRLGAGRNIFPVRVVRHWLRLLGEVVGAPCLNGV